MARRMTICQTRLDRDLAELKLLEIAQVLPRGARRRGPQRAARCWRCWRRSSAWSRPPASNELSSGGCVRHGCPSRRPWPSTTSTSPSESPRPPSCGCSTAISSSGMAVPCLIGPTGTGKTHLLTALGYTAAERGYSVRHTRVVDMINHLTTAQINGLLGNALRSLRPSQSSPPR